MSVAESFVVASGGKCSRCDGKRRRRATGYRVATFGNAPDVKPSIWYLCDAHQQMFDREVTYWMVHATEIDPENIPQPREEPEVHAPKYSTVENREATERIRELRQKAADAAREQRAQTAREEADRRARAREQASGLASSMIGGWNVSGHALRLGLDRGFTADEIMQAAVLGKKAPRGAIQSHIGVRYLDRCYVMVDEQKAKIIEVFTREEYEQRHPDAGRPMSDGMETQSEYHPGEVSA